MGAGGTHRLSLEEVHWEDGFSASGSACDCRVMLAHETSLSLGLVAAQQAWLWLPSVPAPAPPARGLSTIQTKWSGCRPVPCWQISMPLPQCQQQTNVSLTRAPKSLPALDAVASSAPLLRPHPGLGSLLTLSVCTKAAGHPPHHQPLGLQALSELFIFFQSEEEFFFQGV